MSTVDEQRIEYINENYKELLNLIGEKSFKEINKNKNLVKIIHFYVFQIGEKINNLPKRIKLLIGEKEVNKIINIRNEIVHEYESIDNKEIESVIKEYFPRVIKKLNDKKYLLK